MLVMPDIEDVYSLSSASVVVPLQESHHLVGCVCVACTCVRHQYQPLLLADHVVHGLG